MGARAGRLRARPLERRDRARPLELRSRQLRGRYGCRAGREDVRRPPEPQRVRQCPQDRKSTRLNSSHGYISYAVFCLKKKKKNKNESTRYTNAIVYSETWHGLR